MKCECSILKLKLCEVKDTYFDAAGNPEREVTVINLNQPEKNWLVIEKNADELAAATHTEVET